MKIKNYIWLVLIIGLTGTQAAAQKVPTKSARRVTAHRPTATPQTLTDAQVASALDTSIATTCAQTAPSSPMALSNNPQVYTPNRLANTINGIWVGKVSGEYDPQLFASDGYLNVDYYMIVDIKRGQAFVYQEFTSRRSAAGFIAPPGAPKWSYVWCAKENYKSPSPRQVHTFTKVSNNVDDAKPILTNSLGVTFGPTDTVNLGNIWQTLVAKKFFDDPNKSLAYAGVLFNPLTMGNVASGGGGSLMELRMVGEYRGSGQTAAKFNPGQPIYNVEQGHFLGVSSGTTTTTATASPKASTRAAVGTRAIATADSGDYLVSSTEFGNEMVGPKSDADVMVFSTQMAFDKVLIGPLSLNNTTIQPAQTQPAAAAPAKATPANNGGARGGNKLQRRAHP